MIKNRTNILFALIANSALLLTPTLAHAQCADPAGDAGEQVFNSTYAVMQYCDGTKWVAMGSSGGPWAKDGSNLYYNDGNIGLGTTSPVSTLSIGTVGHADYAVHIQTGSHSGLYASGTNTGSFSEGASFGVRGFATADAAAEPRGGDFSSSHIGVYGEADTYGVYGDSANVGVVGYSSGGGQGGNFTSSHIGVYGAGGNHGVYAEGTGDTARAVTGYGTGANAVGGFFSSTTGHALITNVGNVGIGTTTPSEKLEVAGTVEIAGGEVADEARINFAASDKSDRFQILTDLDANYNNDLLKFKTYAHNNLLVLKGDGNVGIGTDTPAAALDVNGGIVIRTKQIYTTPDATTDPGNFIVFLESPIHGAAAGIKAGGILVSDTYAYATPDNNDLIVKGNVGIGTPTPSHPLHVDGTARLGNTYIATDQGGSIELGAQNLVANPVTGGTPFIDFHYGNDIGEDFNVRIINSADSLLKLEAEDSYFTGNVGIGTASPAAKLEVVGNINATASGVNGAIVGSIDTSHPALYGYASQDGWGVYGGSNSGVGGHFTSTSGYALTTGTGNVGIGTTAPIHKLEVNGNILINNSANTNTSTLYHNHNKQIFSGIDGGYAHGVYTFRPGWGATGNTWSRLEMQTADTSGNFTTTLNLHSNGDSYFNGGNVGIGTPTPDTKLTIKAYDTEPETAPTTAIKILGPNQPHDENTSQEIRWDFSAAGQSFIRSRRGLSYDTYIDFGTNDYSNSEKTGTTRMTIADEGYVGIGTTTPGYTLEVAGTFYASGVAGSSDLRKKKDISSLSLNALDTIAKLNPVSFKWKEVKDSGLKGTQMGFIAQEVKEVLPSIVLEQEDKMKTLGLKYNEFIPVLTKAIQEITTELDAVKAENQALKEKLISLEAKMK